MSEVDLPLHLAEMTYQDAARVLEEPTIALLPTGATEAHGPHLPLSTDVIISRTAAEYTARKLRGKGVSAVVLPPLAYAVTEFAAGFDGTISLPQETARNLARDVIVGAIRTGFASVLVCNAHLEPANIMALRAAITEAKAQGAKVAFADVTRSKNADRLGREFKSGACHAGQYETSLVMAAQPFLVRREIAEGLEPNPVSLVVAIRDGKSTFEEAGGSQAYFGFPNLATDAEGNELYEEMSDIFVETAEQFLL